MEKKKVLSIEDDIFLSSLVSTKLTENGFDVLTAATGKEGIAKSKAELPSVILLDLMLPDMGGFEILQAIKGDPVTAHIPVIILSNLGGREEIEQGVKLGADSYLIKSNVLPQEVADLVAERITASEKNQTK